MDLEATYDDHLRLIGKRIVDLGLVSLGVRLRRYERLSVQNRPFRSNGGRLTPKFQVEGVTPANHFFLLRKLG